MKKQKESPIRITTKTQKVALWIALLFGATSALIPIIFSIGQFGNGQNLSQFVMYTLQPLVIFLILFLVPFFAVGRKDALLKRLFRAGFIGVIGGMVFATIQQVPVFMLTSLFSDQDGSSLFGAYNELLYGLYFPGILLLAYTVTIIVCRARLSRSIS